MVNGLLDFRAAPFDLAFERRDPLFQFIDGQRIEILACEQVDRVVRPFGERIVGFHGTQR